MASPQFETCSRPVWHCRRGYHKMSHRTLRRELIQIIYHVDLPSTNRSLAGRSKFKKDQKDTLLKRQKTDIKNIYVHTVEKPPLLPVQDRFMKTLMQDHFINNSKDTYAFSIPQENANVRDLCQCLTSTAMNSMKSSTYGDGEHDAGIDVDHCDYATDASFYFKLVLRNPGGKHTMPVAPAAGGSLRSGSLVVTAHQSHRRGDSVGTSLISTAPLSIGPARDSNLAMDFFEGGWEQIKDNCSSWSFSAVSWTIGGFDSPLPEGITPEDIEHVVGKMMSVGAHPGLHQTNGYEETPDTSQVLRFLGQRDLAHYSCTSIMQLHPARRWLSPWHLLVRVPHCLW